MSIDTHLRSQLSSAVEDTPVPPGLALGAVAGGRRRRRRRAVTAGAALAVATVVAAAVVQLPGSSVGRDGDVASGASAELADGLAWARSLPQGAAPQLPFFGEGGLWSDGQMYDTLGEEVSYDYPPRAVEGGWLVVTGQDEQESHGLAVMAADASLRTLPISPSTGELVDARVAVSPDGRRVAFGSQLIDLATMEVTTLPHAPDRAVQGGYFTDVRVIGFIDEGLVYEASPYEKGLGSTWLLRSDGSTTPLTPPGPLGDDSPADSVVTVDYAADDSDTCVSSYVLSGETWDLAGEGCMGQYLREALSTSPDHRWLITDDLPRVWNLEDGRWDRLDMPVGVGRAQMDAQRGGAAWEDGDTFLLPFADQWGGSTSPEPEFFQHVQVVRCSLSTRSCERAGDEQYLPVRTTMWGTSQLAFAQP